MPRRPRNPPASRTTDVEPDDPVTLVENPRVTPEVQSDALNLRRELKDFLKLNIKFNPDGEEPKKLPKRAEEYVLRIQDTDDLFEYMSFARRFRTGLYGQARKWYNETFLKEGDDADDEDEPDREAIIHLFKQNFNVRERSKAERYEELSALMMEDPWVGSLDRYMSEFNVRAAAIVKRYGEPAISQMFFRGLHSNWSTQLGRTMDTGRKTYFEMQEKLQEQRYNWAHKDDRIRRGPPKKKFKSDEESKRDGRPGNGRPRDDSSRGDGRRTEETQKWLMQGRRCFKCGKQGHRVQECRSPRKSEEELREMRGEHRKAQGS